MLKVTLSYSYEPNSVKLRRENETALSDNSRALYNYLCANPEATLQNAADAIGLSLSGVKKIAAQLREQNLLHRTGSKRNGRWEPQ